MQGFRGIGPAATLEVEPGPGLTLVLGRNGSGKSSFAEALELLVTGQNRRWATRSKVWVEGWRNLHWTGSAEITAEFQVEGNDGPVALERVWEPEDDIAGGDAPSLEELGWEAAVDRFRPFLSYNELGDTFDSPTALYDAVDKILGLDDLNDLAVVLRDARRERDAASKSFKQSRDALLDELRDSEDERVQRIVTALAGRTPDFDAIALTLSGAADGSQGAGELAILRNVCTIETPDGAKIDAAFKTLATAESGLEELAGSDAERAESLAGLLRRALDHTHVHDGDDCPVCGSEGVIDDDWRARATAEADRLSEEARDVAAARRELAAARNAVRSLAPAAVPGAVARAGTVGLDTTAATAAWDNWGTVVAAIDDTPLDQARAALRALVQAQDKLARAAGQELDRREDTWRPIAKQVSGWLGGARDAVDGQEQAKQLKAAEKWVRDTAAALKDERFAPIADQAKRSWSTLRQDSNVSLEKLELKGTGPRRAVDFDVRVDGSQAPALGVMSQGELHALAVSVFLPRASQPESPFRFMVIDDPVQSMDPAKVDGLARVLSDTAADRQVVVFTHDDRLYEAVRRLGIPARAVEVTRRPGSVVELRDALDPVARNVEDAMSLVRTEGLGEEIVARVVPGFCRQALEAAAAAALRRRRLGRGDSHLAVEDELASAKTLKSQLALALFDDASKAGDVLKTLNSRYGKGAADVVVNANRGSHELIDIDALALVRGTEKLAERIAAA